MGCPFIWSGQRGSNSLPGIPQMAFVHLQEPCLTSAFICAPGARWRQRVRSSHKRKRTSRLGCPFIWSGQRGSNSLPGIPQMAFVHLQEPCLTSAFICAPGARWRQRVRSSHKRKRTSRLGCPFIWSGQRGSNSLPPPWQGGALPDELCPRNESYSSKNIPTCQGKIKSFLNFFVSCTFACNFSPSAAYTA